MAEQSVENGVSEAVASYTGDNGAELPVSEETEANGEAADTGEGTQDSYDPTSPEARKWQSVADRQIAKAKAEFEARLAKIEQQQVAQKLKESGNGSETPGAPDIDDILQVDVASMPNIPAGTLGGYFDQESLSAMDQRIAQISLHVARESVRSIAAYNQKAAQEYQKTQVQQKLTGFVGTLDSGQAEAFMPIYTQYQSLAESDPDGFIEFAKVKLGAGPKPQAPARQNLANAVQASGTRPTVNGGTQPRVAQPKSVRDGVAAAVAQVLRRSGG